MTRYTATIFTKCVFWTFRALISVKIIFGLIFPRAALVTCVAFTRALIEIKIEGIRIITYVIPRSARRILDF